MILDSVINFAPVLGVVWKWVKSFALSRLTMFLVLKGTVFFLAYKFLPLLLGRFYQWIHDVSVQSFSSFDLSGLTGHTFPELLGLTVWILQAFKIDTVVDVLISGAVTYMVFKRLSFSR